LLVVSVAVLAAVCPSGFVSAGVPLPDVVLYGQLTIDGQLAQNNDNVAIVARVNGVPDPVAIFRLQGEPGDCDLDRVPDNCELDCGPDDGPCDVPGCGGSVDVNNDTVPDDCQTGFYILRLRIESLADGSQQSDAAALLGQTAEIFIIDEGDGPDEPVAEFVINAVGVLQEINLSVCNRSADSDGDNDVDLTDYQAFQNCVTGPNGGPIAPGCEHADLDCDNDVDVVDWGAFQVAFD
jgi:hypothetical protein